MASGTTDLSAFLYPKLCANTERKVDEENLPCEQEATMICNGCHIVQYCSKECQIADWKLHKKTCKGEHFSEAWQLHFADENRLPAFMGGSGFRSFGSNQFLWGNVPAVDILSIDHNEGKEDIIQRDIALLFAASGDLRNVVKTVARLPKEYAGECVVAINDRNFCITARNIIILLAAIHFQPETAVPIIIHLWYSALLSAPIFRALQDSVLPYVKDVCKHIRGKDSESLKSKTFKLGDRSMRVILSKRQWINLAKMFMPPHGLSTDAAKKIREATMMAPERIDYIDRVLQNMSPAQRVSYWKFRTEGLLLPHGTSRKHFVISSPTFFTKEGIWPMKDNANPLHGWSYNEYMACATGAKNDVYGAFFVFLRRILPDFCKQIQTFKITFQLFAIDAIKLPDYLNRTTFDRIEISNICDRGYVGVDRTLQIFSPMLKPKTENPHATLLMLFMNTVTEEESKSGPDVFRVYQANEFMSGIGSNIFDIWQDRPCGRQLEEPPSLANSSIFSYVMNMFGDFDSFFNRFLGHPDPHKAGSMDTLSRMHGMKVKTRHTIIEPWPFRVRSSTSKAVFRIMLSQGMSGSERYVEIEKLDEGDQ